MSIPTVTSFIQSFVQCKYFFNSLVDFYREDLFKKTELETAFSNINLAFLANLENNCNVRI